MIRPQWSWVALFSAPVRLAPRSGRTGARFRAMKSAAWFARSAMWNTTYGQGQWPHCKAGISWDNGLDPEDMRTNITRAMVQRMREGKETQLWIA